MPFPDKDLSMLNRQFDADYRLLLNTEEGLNIQKQAQSLSHEMQMLNTDIVARIVPSDETFPAREVG